MCDEGDATRPSWIIQVPFDATNIQLKQEVSVQLDVPYENVLLYIPTTFFLHLVEDVPVDFEVVYNRGIFRLVYELREERENLS